MSHSRTFTTPFLKSKAQHLFELFSLLLFNHLICRYDVHLRPSLNIQVLFSNLSAHI